MGYLLMKKLALVIGMMVMMSGSPVYADNHLGDKAWNAIGLPVKGVVIVSHEVLHILGAIGTGVLAVTHSALDVFNIPWSE